MLITYAALAACSINKNHTKKRKVEQALGNSQDTRLSVEPALKSFVAICPLTRHLQGVHNPQNQVEPEKKSPENVYFPFVSQSFI